MLSEDLTSIRIKLQMLKHHNADIDSSDGFELIVQTNLEVVYLTFYGSLTNTLAISLLYIDTPIFF